MTLDSTLVERRCALLTVPEVAGLWKVPPRKVYVLLASGRLRAIRIGRTLRVDPRELERFLAAGGTVAAARAIESVEQPA